MANLDLAPYHAVYQREPAVRRAAVYHTGARKAAAAAALYAT